MNPRLKTSTQWTPFPEELALQIQEVLSERFAKDYDIESFDFVVQGRIYKEEILLRTGLNSTKQLKQPNFELSLQFDPKKDKVFEVIHKSMDLIDSLWENFLEEDMEDTDLPRQWTSLVFGNLSTHYLYSTTNTELEKQADILLENYEKKLVYDEDPKREPSIPLEPESRELH